MKIKDSYEFMKRIWNSFQSYWSGFIIPNYQIESREQEQSITKLFSFFVSVSDCEPYCLVKKISLYFLYVVYKMYC